MENRQSGEGGPETIAGCTSLSLLPLPLSLSFMLLSLELLLRNLSYFDCNLSTTITCTFLLFLSGNSQPTQHFSEISLSLSPHSAGLLSLLCIHLITWLIVIRLFGLLSALSLTDRTCDRAAIIAAHESEGERDGERVKQ